MRKKTILSKTAEELIKNYSLNGYRPDGNKTTAKDEKKERGETKHVYLRGKIQRNNKVSLYLYFCKNGKAQKEYLNIVLNPEINNDIKQRNEESYRQAATIANEKDAILQKNINGFALDNISKVKILPYIEKLADKKLAETGNKHSYYYILHSLETHLVRCFGTDDLKFNRLDVDFVRQFIQYLKTADNMNFHKSESEEKQRKVTISQNFQNNLFKRFVFVIKEAAKDGIISSNPIEKLERSEKPKAEDGTREFLTIEEIKKLMIADCRNENLKRAFLFCCLVGLRYSDVSSITWGELRRDNDGDIQLNFKVKKTKRNETPPVSNEALKWLPNRNAANDNEIIFNLPKNDSANKQLARWINSAGINKKITFHCSRHTAATLNLSLDVPIEVVSKLLGHTKIATTQIYAKIVNKAQKKAVNKQNGIFDNK